MISDGIETCDLDPGDEYYPPDVAKALRASGIDVQVNVVGFDLKDEAAIKLLKAIAKAGGGRYFPASDTQSLHQSMTDVLSTTFSVQDQNGNIIHRGQIGDIPTFIEPGTYQLTIHTDPATIVELWCSKQETPPM